MYKPDSTWTWSFVGVTSVQAVIVLAFESYVFGRFQIGVNGEKNKTDEDYPSTIPTFLTLFIFGLVYELFLVWDALRLKNTIQVIGLCIYNLGLMIYAIVQMVQVDEAVKFLQDRQGNNPNESAIDPTVWPATKPFLIAIPCVIGIGTLFMSAVAWKLYDEFAWTIYKHISADLRMKKRYLTYQIYIALLKFDFFFFLGFTIQFIVIVGNKYRDYEFYLTIAAIPVTIFILLLAGIFTRRENRLGMIAIITLYFAALAYFLFKCVRMYDKRHPGKVADYKPARRSLTTFAVLTIILIIFTIVNAIMCLLNFNRGLKPYISQRKVESEEEKHQLHGSQMEMPHLNYTSAQASSRMTID